MIWGTPRKSNPILRNEYRILEEGEADRPNARPSADILRHHVRLGELPCFPSMQRHDANHGARRELLTMPLPHIAPRVTNPLRAGSKLCYAFRETPPQGLVFLKLKRFSALCVHSHAPAVEALPSHRDWGRDPVFSVDNLEAFP